MILISEVFTLIWLFLLFGFIIVIVLVILFIKNDNYKIRILIGMSLILILINSIVQNPLFNLIFFLILIGNLIYFLLFVLKPKIIERKESALFIEEFDNTMKRNKNEHSKAFTNHNEGVSS